MVDEVGDLDRRRPAQPRQRYMRHEFAGIGRKPHPAQDALMGGLQALQRAFREASSVPDAPGAGPGEKYTGPVY